MEVVMIKLKDLLVESMTVSDSEFIELHNQARKETGTNDKIPAKTKQMCKEVEKYGFHKLDYKGKSGRARKPKNLMYQYYAYIQGWGHGAFKGPADWFLKGTKKDPILKWFWSKKHYALKYDYLLYHVTTDLQAVQIVSNIRPGSKDVEPAYYLVKDYLNSFGDRRGGRNESILLNKVEWWLEKNKVQTK